VSVLVGHAARAGLVLGGGKSESRECTEWE